MTTSPQHEAAPMEAPAAPLLTVVVPTHNVEEWLDDCLSSLRDQSVADCQIIVVDDHSSDATVALAEVHAAEDPRVEVVRSPEHGGGSARNLGAAFATGRYIAFADGDDMVPRNAYATAIAALEDSRADMSMSDYLTYGATWTRRRSSTLPIYGSQRLVTLDEEPRILRDRVVWNKVFRRSWWLDQRLRFPDSIRSNDIAAMVQALTRANVLLVPELSYVYRSRPGQGSMTAGGASSASMRAHFAQELRCAELVAASGSHRALEYYRSMVFGMDAIAHLRRYPAVWDGEEGRQVRDAVRVLWAEVHPQAALKLRPEARWIFEELAAGAPHGMSFLPRKSRELLGAPAPDALPQEVAGRLAADQAAALLRDSVNLARRSAPLARRAELERFAARIRSLADLAGSESSDLRVSALVAACTSEHPAEDLRMFGTRVEVPRVTVSAARTTSGGRVELDLDLSRPDPVDAELEAVELVEESSGELRRIELLRGRTRIAVDPQAFPAQTAWSMLAVLRAPSGVVWRLPVMRDAAPTPRRAALGLRDGRPGAAMLLDMRRSIPSRVMIKSTALARRVAHEAQRRSARSFR